MDEPNDDLPDSFWLLSFSDGGVERVDRATVDEIERAIHSGYKTLCITSVSGSTGLIVLAHITCCGESTPAMRERDDRIRAKVRQEEKGRRIELGLEDES